MAQGSGTAVFTLDKHGEICIPRLTQHLQYVIRKDNMNCVQKAAFYKVRIKLLRAIPPHEGWCGDMNFIIIRYTDVWGDKHHCHTL